MLAVGAVIDGKYEILKRLGGGGFGEVFLARQAGFERGVAVKVLRGEVDEETRGRFYREAKALSVLGHPNIATFLGYGMWEGVPYTVLEYVEGETLAERLARGQMRTGEAVVVAKEIAAALKHAHTAGIVHRDLKPANVIFAKNLPGEPVKLIDFGFAHVDSTGGQRLTQEGLALGTAQYMSPEQALGQAVDGRSDLYALGCILFHCLEGHPPFEGDNAVAIMYQHVQQPTPICTAAQGTVLEEIVQTLLAREAGDRYQSASEVLDALARSSEHHVGKRSSQRMRVPSSIMPSTVSLVVILGTICGAYLLMHNADWPQSPAQISSTAPSEIPRWKALQIAHEFQVKAGQTKDYAATLKLMLSKRDEIIARLDPIERWRYDEFTGECAWRAGDHQTARRLTQECLDRFDDLGEHQPDIDQSLAQCWLVRSVVAAALNEKFVDLPHGARVYAYMKKREPNSFSPVLHDYTGRYVYQLFAAHQYAEAVKVCHDSVAVAPPDLQAHWQRYLGNAEDSLGNTSTAIDAVKRSLNAARQLKQDDEVMCSGLFLGSLCEKSGNKQGAISAWTEAAQAMRRTHTADYQGTTIEEIEQHTARAKESI